MRDIELHGSANPWSAWQAMRAVAGTHVVQFVVTLLLSLALLLARSFDNG